MVRCLKEFRILAVCFVCAIIAVIVSGTLLAMTAAPVNKTAIAWMLLCAGQWIFFNFMGVQSFAAEFEHGTMPRLLVQPVSRVRIWREKMSILALLILAVVALSILMGGRTYSRIAGFAVHSVPTPAAASHEWAPSPFWQAVCMISGGMSVDGVPWASVNQSLATVKIAPEVASALNMLNLGLVVMVCGALSAFCCGPTMALFLRQGHIAFWATLVAPMLYLVLVTIVFGLFGMWPAIADMTQHNSDPSSSVLSAGFAGGYGGQLILLLPFFIVMYLLGRRQFMRLEV